MLFENHEMLSTSLHYATLLMKGKNRLAGLLDKK